MSFSDFPTNIREQNTALLDLDLNPIGGTVPTDLEGHAFWMVPTPQAGATPWFNGYGQLYRLNFEGDRVHLKSSPFETPSVICDRKIQEKFPLAALAQAVPLGLARRIGKAKRAHLLHSCDERVPHPAIEWC